MQFELQRYINNEQGSYYTLVYIFILAQTKDMANLILPMVNSAQISCKREQIYLIFI